MLHIAVVHFSCITIPAVYLHILQLIDVWVLPGTGVGNCRAHSCTRLHACVLAFLFGVCLGTDDHMVHYIHGQF